MSALDPYPVELFARCLLLEAGDIEGMVALLSQSIGRWKVYIRPPLINAGGIDPAPILVVIRLDVSPVRSVEREIPELGALASLIDEQRAERAALEGLLLGMIELGAPRPPT